MRSSHWQQSQCLLILCVLYFRSEVCNIRIPWELLKWPRPHPSKESQAEPRWACFVKLLGNPDRQPGLRTTAQSLSFVCHLPSCLIPAHYPSQKQGTFEGLCCSVPYSSHFLKDSPGLLTCLKCMWVHVWALTVFTSAFHAVLGPVSLMGSLWINPTSSGTWEHRFL